MFRFVGASNKAQSSSNAIVPRYPSTSEHTLLPTTASASRQPQILLRMTPSPIGPKYRVVIGSLPESLFLWKEHHMWQPVKDLLRELSQNYEGHPEPQHCDVNPVNRLALCPYVEAKHAWEAYGFLQGYRWSFEGHDSILKAWLIEWDSQGRPHKLAGPGNDNKGVTPVYSPSATSPGHSPTSRRTIAKNCLPPARFGNSGSLQMVSRSIDQGDARYHPASGMMQSQYASSAYQAVDSYAPLTRPRVCNPGQYSGGAAPSNSPSFDLGGFSSEQQLGQTHFGQPPSPPRTVSSTSSLSSVSTTFASSIASGVGDVRVPGPSSITSGDPISSSGVSTSGPCIVASCYSPARPTAGGVSIRGRSSIASDESAFSSMVGGLSISGLSSVPSSALSSPTTFRRSSQASTISQPAHGTYELWVYPIPTGTSEEIFNAEVLEATLGRYTSHAGITMVDTDEQMQVYVTYYEEDQAKQAAKKLGKVCYKGKKLRAHLKEGIEGRVRI